MALSGTFGNTFTTGYRIQVDWTANQDPSKNQSTIQAILYWVSLGSGYTVNSSDSKTASITLDGTVNNTTIPNAGLGGNQKKEIHRFTKIVNHDASGNKSASIVGRFDCAVTLGGTYFSTVSTSGTAVLDNIETNSVSFNVKNSTGWVTSKGIWVNNGSSWIEAKGVWVHNGTTWKPSK